MTPDQAVAAAVSAAAGWAAAPPQERAEGLTAIADALEAARAELVALADEESHLGETRLNGELTRTTFQLRLFADQVREGAFYDARIDRPDPQWPSGPRPDLRRYRTALGPVLVFAASNFPFAFSVAGGDTASALAAGCPVVLKAHPGHPRLSRRTAEIIAGAGLPDGVFGLIEGEAEGVEALRHPGIAAAAFTGSEKGGLALAKIAAERPTPIPFFGELGSVNPTVVTPRAAETRPDEIAQGYAASLTLGAGQFCTNPGLLFAPEALVDEIAERLRGVAAAPMLNDRIEAGFLSVSDALGARPGVRRVVWPEDGASTAPRLLTMDLAAFRADADAAGQECFGPLGLVVTYDDLADVADAVAALPGQLTTSLHAEQDETGDLAALTGVLADRSGRVLWNQWPTGVAVSYAMEHGGPYPATTAPATTSVGTAAIERFLRPVAFQGWPQELLPPPLRDDNPWKVPQTVH
ncbi:Alpha-ketoglutaric semialdehyde dehydrogenase [Actinomadura sp. RB99]|jgi:NADP-dependent aldehyde dehydrogenase|uniref:aldehyde dehydrogenase (NADP(+)) n=1 Tax=Actinomadura sp. RB99 TaxID=2691577 RepID=UPI00168296E5|nr:aldehyde dehydrogenase (NADP(+)) [Actinomadura sp. RB99]MBD2900645.1 Alpha-ketoglutaric semialdehyde dehydrogenase [Actinomadura sp. RB99]